MKLVEKVALVLMTILLLATPFLIYRQIKAGDECESRGGVLVKSSSGWSCIAALKKESER
jgi:hypothetical protein